MEKEDQSTEETSSQRAEFAWVVFHNIPETYPVDAHINCSYTLTEDMVSNSRDWVGLYKVGWMSTGDYYYYEWAPIPANYQAGKETESSVMFPAHKLPGDDGEFYQFCYVTNSAMIRGASTPFQFKKPSADDFVELEDSETDMLIVRSKTVVLEERMHVLEVEKQQMELEKKDLEKERDGLVASLYETDQQLREVTEANTKLLEEATGRETELLRLHQEAHDMNIVRSELQTKIESTSENREEMAKRISDLNEKIAGLKADISRLQNEKDELDGENRSLKQQIEMYKNHCLSSEMSTKQYAEQIEEMKKYLTKAEQTSAELQTEIVCLKAELAQAMEDNSEKDSTANKQMDNIDRLTEKLKNTEDKLEAAENTKILLQEEIRSYQETTAKMSRDLEQAEDKYLNLRNEMQEVGDSRSVELALLNSKVEALTKDIEVIVKEKEQLQKEKLTLSEELEHTTDEKVSLTSKLEHSISLKEGSMSSMHCLQMAQQKLKERYAKMEQQYNELHADASKRAKDSKQHLKDLLRENEDLKERLNMASNEYRALFITNSKVQKKLEKYKGKVRNTYERKLSGSSASSQTFVVDVPQTSSLEEQVSSPESPEQETVLSEQDRLEQRIESMVEEIQRRKDKKNKYKQMFAEEKGKVETLRKHYLEESRKKDQELSRLRTRIEDTASQNENKVRSLEKFLAERELTIGLLQQQIRDMNISHDKPVHSPSEGTASVTKENTIPVASAPLPTPLEPEKLTSSVAGTAAGAAPVFTPSEPGAYANPFIPYRQPNGSTAYMSPLVYPGYPRMHHFAPPAYPGVGNTPTLLPPETLVYPDPKAAAKTPVTKEEILTPLPPPLEPERVNGPCKLVTCPPLRDTEILDPLVLPAVPSAPVCQDSKEERFEDAIGEAMKICPVCNDSFSADIDSNDFDTHVLSHIGRICPICHNLIEEVNDDQFQYHVNRHLEDHCKDDDDEGETV